MLESSRPNADIQNDVMQALKWDRSIHAENVTAKVSDGIVTVFGKVPHYSEKVLVSEAIERVLGVKAVANELQVELLASYERSDEDIAKAAVHALERNNQVPSGVQVTVEGGWITLLGNAEWEFQRASAQQCLIGLIGVRGVSNRIELHTKASSADIKSSIEKALGCSAGDESREITVDVNGEKATLSGHVHSFSERNDAGCVAWNAPGVMMVSNLLKIVA